MWVVKDVDKGTYYTNQKRVWTTDIHEARTYRTKGGAKNARNSARTSAEKAREHRLDVGENIPEKDEHIQIQSVRLQEDPPLYSVYRDYEREPKAGDVALNDDNLLGLVTSDEPQEVRGYDEKVYTGVHLEHRPDKGAERGDRWVGHHTQIITTVEGLRDYALASLIIRDKSEDFYQDLEPLPGTDVGD